MEHEIEEYPLTGYCERGAIATISLFLVGARRPRAGEWRLDYQGPEARISCDERWFYIIEDERTGAVALNIEALPFFREAICKLEQYARSNGYLRDGADIVDHAST